MEGTDQANRESEAVWARCQCSRQNKSTHRDREVRRRRAQLRSYKYCGFIVHPAQTMESMQIRVVVVRLRGALHGKENPVEIPSFL